MSLMVDAQQLRVLIVSLKSAEKLRAIWIDIRDLTILGRQRDGNGYQHNRSLKRIG
jgi:hypothetical protein